MWRLGWWSLLLLLLQGQWHDFLNMTCLRLQVFGQMTWDIKRVFPYYKRTHVLKDLKTPTPRKTDTSPETTHHRYRKEKNAPSACACGHFSTQRYVKPRSGFTNTARYFRWGVLCWVCRMQGRSAHADNFGTSSKAEGDRDL